MQVRSPPPLILRTTHACSVFPLVHVSVTVYVRARVCVVVYVLVRVHDCVLVYVLVCVHDCVW